MGAYTRRSPVTFDDRPRKRAIRGNWEVVLEYERQGNGPFLIDLSHISKWDVQDSDLSRIGPWGAEIPPISGQCVLEKGMVITRMNRTQAAVWHLLEDRGNDPEGRAYTDITDAFAILAVLGNEVFSLMEKITNLDLCLPEEKPPFLVQGPVLRVPCQVVVMEPRQDLFAVLMACARGYGLSMAESLLAAGRQWGLRPAGETAFLNWLKC
jgi:hypothetical protein